MATSLNLAHVPGSGSQRHQYIMHLKSGILKIVSCSLTTPTVMIRQYTQRGNRVELRSTRRSLSILWQQAHGYYSRICDYEEVIDGRPVRVDILPGSNVPRLMISLYIRLPQSPFVIPGVEFRIMAEMLKPLFNGQYSCSSLAARVLRSLLSLLRIEPRANGRCGLKHLQKLQNDSSMWRLETLGKILREC